ncbi:MAG TPA: SH3 domain-containing protein [Acidobacteriaceae bacterium]|nr:SH3 domain-containing protein [Acidobacteriaceae bacterium]
MGFSSAFFRRFAPALILGFLLMEGCGRFAPHAAREYVYVWARGTSLRDRVAAVSNRVAEVTNGQRLEVVEHGHRFLKVKTEKGDVGWIEDHAVIDQSIYDRFRQMEKGNAGDPVVATGVLREDYWLRDAPGRTSDRFYLLPENSKLQLLERASVPRPEAPQPVPMPVKKAIKPEKKRDLGDLANPALEDYWLVRDSSGQVGWVRGRMVDEDVPDAIAGLAEGQKIVGAYVLKKVEDPGANVPGDQVSEYVTALAPWRGGLPFDFDQVRVFTWNVKKHRYETAYRERNIAGYLPVTVSQQTFGNQTEPVFSFRVAADAENASLDPQTGMVKPGSTTTEAYHMEGVLVRRVGGAAAPQVASTSPPRKTERRGHHRRRRR